MTKELPNAAPPTSVRGRVAALLVGVLYISVIAGGFSDATKTPYARSLLLVCIASWVIMVVMVVFSVKAYKQQGPVRQFRLSSLFLLMIPVAIYSAALRPTLANMPAGVPVAGWVIAIVACLVFVLISTIVLLWLADALMWLAVLAVRIARYVRQSDSET